MHNKFMVVDWETVEEFQITRPRQKERTHDPAVAGSKGRSGERLLEESEELKARY